MRKTFDLPEHTVTQLEKIAAQLGVSERILARMILERELNRLAENPPRHLAEVV